MSQENLSNSNISQRVQNCAYKTAQDREKQQQACNEMMEPEKLEEAIEVVREYKRKAQKTPEA